MIYNFVGYGSLLSHKSLKETLKDKKFKPVIVKGYKRIFDLITRRNQNSDVLNLEKSKKHFFNGVMFSTDEKELKKLCKRETEYTLEKTYAYNWGTRKKIFCFMQRSSISPKQKIRRNVGQNNFYFR